MFNCELCSASIGPRLSPIVVSTSRSRSYDTFDVEGNPIVTSGSEIDREINSCRDCAGLPPLTSIQPFDMEFAKARAATASKHAAKCSKDPFSCKECKLGMAFFAALPPQVLSDILN